MPPATEPPATEPPATEPPATEPPATEPAGGFRGLLLDIGGVVHATGIHLVGRLAEAEPAVRPVLERIGGIATDRDELWQAMLAGQVTERQYWAQRAAELGAAVGQPWDTRAMIGRLYQLPQRDWLRADMVNLMTEAKAAGLRVGVGGPRTGHRYRQRPARAAVPDRPTLMTTPTLTITKEQVCR